MVQRIDNIEDNDTDVKRKMNRSWFIEVLILVLGWEVQRLDVSFGDDSFRPKAPLPEGSIHRQVATYQLTWGER